MNIEVKLNETGIKFKSDEFNALGSEFADKYSEMQLLSADNKDGKNDEAIAVLQDELIALFDENYLTKEQLYQQAIQHFLHEFAVKEEQSVHEVSLYVKFHKPEKDCELHIHLIKNGTSLQKKILNSEDLPKDVMTQIERHYTKVAKENDTPISLITYEIHLPQNAENLVIKPIISGMYKAAITINNLIN